MDCGRHYALYRGTPSISWFFLVENSRRKFADCVRLNVANALLDKHHCEFPDGRVWI